MRIKSTSLIIAPLDDAPGWVDAILDWRWTWPITRLALTSLFLMAAAVEIRDFPAAAAIQEHFGLRPGWMWAIATIAVQLTGSALILSGRYIWLGAGMLGVFTGATEVISHRFWELSGAAEFAARNEFFEHLALIAGLVMVARLSRSPVAGAGLGASMRRPPP
jgi:uncharacterized membrane protein YphA (DoxX/SURF4 family)